MFLLRWLVLLDAFWGVGARSNNSAETQQLTQSGHALKAKEWCAEMMGKLSEGSDIHVNHSHMCETYVQYRPWAAERSCLVRQHHRSGSIAVY